MSNTDPRYQRTTESPEQTDGPGDYGTNRTGYGDNRTDYNENRNDFNDNRNDFNDSRTDYGDSRTEYRDNTASRQPVSYERIRTDGNGSSDGGDIATRKVRETKPAFLTTEFWFAAGGIAALIVIYLIEDDPSLDLFRTALLATLIGIAYIVSRGLAKAGSRTTWQPEDPRLVGRDLP